MDTQFQTSNSWYTLNILVNIYECTQSRSFAQQKNYAVPILDHNPPLRSKTIRIFFCTLRTVLGIYHQKFAGKRSGQVLQS